MAWWAWLILGLLLLAGELLTPGGLYLLFAGIGALVVGLLVLTGLGGPAWVQWVLFSVISVSSLWLLRGRLARNRAQSDIETIDSLVGQRIRISTPIEPGAVGRGEYRGSVWEVQNLGSEALDAGTLCRINRVDGVTISVGDSEGEAT
jgi:membrane protein implicated in regulation of membrane protease activity